MLLGVGSHVDLSLPSLLFDATNDCDDDSDADERAGNGNDPPEPDQIIYTVIVVVVLGAKNSRSLASIVEIVVIISPCARTIVGARARLTFTIVKVGVASTAVSGIAQVSQIVATERVVGIGAPNSHQIAIVCRGYRLLICWHLITSHFSGLNQLLM